MSKKDQVFGEKLDEVKAFEFNDAVAEVFDDMVARSVPFYDEIHKIVIDLVGKYCDKDDLIYDLGCSTGTTIDLIHRNFPDKNLNFVGCDNSASMIQKCNEKLKESLVDRCQLICGDIADLDLQTHAMSIMNYTLQFISPQMRPKLLKKIYSALVDGGIFLFAEKIMADDKVIDDLQIELYYDFKRRNGYSELEIAQKREALENVLIPVSYDRQLELLKEAGFKKVDMLFKWYNFAFFIGIK